MKPDIFQLDFSRITVLLFTLIPVIINFGIFIYISLYLTRTRVTGYFSLFVFMLGCWQLADGSIRMSITLDAVEMWYRISIIFALFSMLFGVLFAIYYTKLDKKISRNVIFSFFVFPTFIFFLCILAHLDKYSIVVSEKWYWIVNPKPTIITTALLFWLSAGGLIMLFLFSRNYFKMEKSSFEQRQSFLLVLGSSFPILIGIVVEVVLPLIFDIDGIPITTSLTTSISIMSLIAIKKYGLLDFSPKHQWDDIVKTMNEGILIVDLDEKIKYANDAFCNLVGYDFSEMKEKNATELFVKDNDGRTRMKPIVEARKNNISNHYEICLTTKSGEKKWLLVGGSPYYDKEGKIIGSIGIHSDITKRKEMEENLIASNNELEIFIYKASHDLRGPLASIMGLVNVSNYEIKDELSRRYMDMIGSSTQKLDHTLLELVKTMKIKDTERFDDQIDFKNLIETKLSEFEFFKDFEKLKIDINIYASDKFYSNKFLIETILHNLIENAIKYQSGTEPQSYLKIDVADQPNGIQIIIEDNGIGIKSSVQGLIFDMYYKAVETSRGSGLGLYLVKKCVEKLDAEIDLKSFIGKGSTFTISLKNGDKRHQN
ncbi:MAG: hypothetical protein A3K10_03585 [Bacteroidetes bacterium RIFCSPLOWO2_12_FULL_31_6]|nr:MAG: hypothetical protein A3K10_03585 [Bacteroidetes bacterium RIFCSPLOWO2_12_FULL_31_6]